MTNTSTITGRYERITNQLNYDFYGYESKIYHSIYSGSYGRDTGINGLSDLDMIFWLGWDRHANYDSHAWNGQSQLIQDIKYSIKKTYPLTEAGGDGQVVSVSFSDGMVFEVLPAFENDDKSFTYPDSNSGGSWKKTDPRPEEQSINSLNRSRNKNLKRLCRMMRAWKQQWNVQIKGLLVDTLAYNFLSSHKEYETYSFLYYDWLSRDFLKYLSEQDENQSFWYAPGSYQKVWRVGSFESKAKRCYNLALDAIAHDAADRVWSRNNAWREIYGTKFPV